MSEYKEMAADLGKWMGEIGKAMPDVGQGFQGLVKASEGKGALDKKVKELISIAISIANRCEGCIAFHVRSAVKLGITRDEFLEMIATAIYMGGGPSFVYGAKALKAFDEFSG